MKVNNFFNIFAKFADKYFFYKSKESEPTMNGVLSVSRLMKVSEVVKRCAEIRHSPALLLITELEAKCQLREMNRKVSARREVS